MTEGADEGTTPAATPPDWYPDPNQPNTLRYWDGTQWTEQRAPASHRSTKGPTAAIVGLIAAGGMALGAVGPWVDSVFITVNGMDGDGVIVLLSAVVAGILLAVAVTSKSGSYGVLSAGAVLCGLLAGGTSIYDLSQIFGTETRIFGEDVRVATAGWGLWLSAVASVVLVGASAVLAGTKQADA